MKRVDLYGLLFLIVFCCSALLVSCLPTDSNETVLNDDLIESTDAASVVQEISVTATPSIVENEEKSEPVSERTQPAEGLDSGESECREQARRMQEVFVPESATGEKIRVLLSIPPCGLDSETNTYSLVVLLHGQSSTAEQWVDLGFTDSLEDPEPDEADSAQQIIFAMPQEDKYLLPIVESGFGTFLSDDMMPYLLENYPISTDRGTHAIGGISRGAIWALKVGLTDWEQFGAIGLHSYPGGINSSILWLRSIPDENWPAIYMDSGSSDLYIQNVLKLENEFNEYLVPHEWHLNEGAHDAVYWSDQVANYLEWYQKEALMSE